MGHKKPKPKKLNKCTGCDIFQQCQKLQRDFLDGKIPLWSCKKVEILIIDGELPESEPDDQLASVCMKCLALGTSEIPEVIVGKDDRDAVVKFQKWTCPGCGAEFLSRDF